MSVYQQIRANPKFHELVSRRARLVWLLFAIVLAAYYSLMIVVAFQPGILREPLGQATVVTVGIPVGIGIIVVSWLLTGLYVYKANTQFDKLSDSILDEVRQ